MQSRVCAVSLLHNNTRFAGQTQDKSITKRHRINPRRPRRDLRRSRAAPQGSTRPSAAQQLPHHALDHLPSPEKPTPRGTCAGGSGGIVPLVTLQRDLFNRHIKLAHTSFFGSRIVLDRSNYHSTGRSQGGACCFVNRKDGERWHTRVLLLRLFMGLVRHLSVGVLV